MSPQDRTPISLPLPKNGRADHPVDENSLVAADPYLPFRKIQPLWERHGIWLHYLESCDRVEGRHVEINGQRFVNFSSYNYLGYAGDPRVTSAAKDAIDQYGTSVSASRLVSGERPIGQQLEQQIAEMIGAEDCLVYTSGHATNVTTLGCLFGPKDLIVYDVLCHNSIQQGIKLSGATAFRFLHNDAHHLEHVLSGHRKNHSRALIITEGVFSMDGDIADIPKFIRLKERYDSYLMVDEAHSMGVIGPRGRGVADHFQLSGSDVDIWMGTLSKSLASCGGYIAGSQDLITSLRYAAPGFVYSCGISPANAAAALASVHLLKREPERVEKLRQNVELFKKLADASGLDTGLAQGAGIVPVITGCSITALFVAHMLYEKGIIVHPLFYPIVRKKAARLRFFLTALHTREEIEAAVTATVEAVEKARTIVTQELSDLDENIPQV